MFNFENSILLHKQELEKRSSLVLMINKNIADNAKKIDHLRLREACSHD